VKVEAALLFLGSIMRRHLFVTLVAGLLLATVSLGRAAALANEATHSYIVVLAPEMAGLSEIAGVSVRAASLAHAYGGEVGFVYEHALRGFSIEMSPQAAAALARNPQVAYVEADQVVSIDAQTTPTGIQRVFADDNPYLDIDGIDDFRVDVDVAVIDSGVDFQHPDLNVVGGVTCMSPPCVSGGDDDRYHGTHVAGTIAALDNGFGVVGVAPGARIWAVKVLDSAGNGTSTTAVAGIDWVAAHAATIEVANMSFGGEGWSQATYDAVQGAVNAGVAFAAAAGNDAADAAGYWPAAFSNVLTVSGLADFNGAPGGLGSSAPCALGMEIDDWRYYYSNYGSVVDVAAPGFCILSSVPAEIGFSYGYGSGTSMASPHAAGALALLASVSNPNNSSAVYSLYNQVKAAGNFNWTDDSGDGIKEPLLDVSAWAPAVVPPGAPSGLVATPGNGLVTVSFTPPASDGGAAITDYVVAFRPLGGSFALFADPASTVPQITVSGLANGVTYEFAVAALNAAGLGAWSSTTTRAPNGSGPVPPQAPYGLSAVPGDGQVTVSFSAPPANGGAAVTDYVVIFRPLGGVWAWFPEAASTGLSVTVSGLVNGVTYEFAVAALNSAGLGSWSGMTATGTPNGVGPVPPQAPYNLSAIAGNGQVTVSFAPPSSAVGGVQFSVTWPLPGTADSP